MGIARAVHSPENRAFLQQVVNSYPSGSFKADDILAFERGTNMLRPELLQEDSALREKHTTKL